MSLHNTDFVLNHVICENINDVMLLKVTFTDHYEVTLHLNFFQATLSRKWKFWGVVEVNKPFGTMTDLENSWVGHKLVEQENLWVIDCREIKLVYYSQFRSRNEKKVTS